MKIAGEAHEKAFFKEVRFFSATANSVRFKVRIHRGVLAEENDRIHDNYPLAFAFEDVFKAEGEKYNYQTVAGIVRNIFVEYGVGTLLPILKKAVVDLQQKLKNPTLRREALDLLDKLKGARQAPGNTPSVYSEDFITSPMVTSPTFGRLGDGGQGRFKRRKA
jgi:hypothetical protein